MNNTIQYYLITKALLIKNSLEIGNIVLGMMLLGLLVAMFLEPEDYKKIRKEYRSIIIKGFLVTTLLNALLPNTEIIKIIITEWSKK